MIALEKSQELLEEYVLWLKTVEVELYEHFDKYEDKQAKAKDWIKQTHREKIQSFLFPSSHEKCAYCERKPNEGGGNLEIEHFIAKSTDRTLVFSIQNLLPSCKQCNTAKSTKDSQSLLNPYNETGFKTHLALDIETMKISGLSESGKETVRILGLSLNTKEVPFNKKLSKGALYARINIKNAIDKALSIKIKHKNAETIDPLFDEIIGLIEWIDVKEKHTSTYATYLFENLVFKGLLAHIESKDAKKFAEIEKLMSEKSKYCLAINASN